MLFWVSKALTETQKWALILFTKGPNHLHLKWKYFYVVIYFQTEDKSDTESATVVHTDKCWLLNENNQLTDEVISQIKKIPNWIQLLKCEHLLLFSALYQLSPFRILDTQNNLRSLCSSMTGDSNLSIFLSSLRKPQVKWSHSYIC